MLFPLLTYFEKLNFEIQRKGYKIKNMSINIRQANDLGPLSIKLIYLRRDKKK